MKYELNNIYNEDSYKAIKDIPDNSIDLIIVDPPYHFESDGGGGAFGSKKRDYHNVVTQPNFNRQIDNDFLDEIKRIMKKMNCYIFCNKEQLLQYMTHFKEYRFDLLFWRKLNPTPTCNNKYLSDVEYILFFREKGVKLYGSYHTKSKLFESIVNKSDKKLFKHPTIKPLNIIKDLIINSSQENEIVLDLFIGSGTTPVAAKESNRQYIGFEIDPKYYKIAKDRLNGITASGQTSMFTNFNELDV